MILVGSTVEALFGIRRVMWRSELCAFRSERLTSDQTAGV